MNFQINLTYQQQTLLSQIIDQYQITQKNQKVLLKYYHHFVKILNLEKENSEQFRNLLQISLIFTQKSNFYKTIEGKLFPGICFSMNDILKNKPYLQIKQLTKLTKDILLKARFRQQILKIEISKLIFEIQEGIDEKIMYQSLMMIFLNNSSEDFQQTSNYQQKLMNFGWYLYLDSKNNCLAQIHHLEKKYLMVSIIQTLIINSLNFLNPLVLRQASPNRNRLSSPNQQKKKIIAKIFDILLKQSQVSMEEIIQYQNINQLFDSYFDHLTQTSIIQSTNDEKFDFLSPSSILINLRNLDKKLSKQIQSTQIDLRKLNFLQLSRQTSSKKIAIDDQIFLNQKKQEKIKPKKLRETHKKYKSHRILNLDKCQLQFSASSKDSEQGHVLPSSIGFAPVRMSIPILHKVSEKDELNQYLFEKTKRYILPINSYESSILEFVQDCFEQFCRYFDEKTLKLSSQSKFQAYQLYSYLKDQAWGNQTNSYKVYRLQQNQSMHKSLLIIAISVVMMNELSLEKHIVFEKIISLSCSQYIDMIYTCIYMLQENIPKILAENLKKLIKDIVRKYLWSDDLFIEQLMEIQQNFLNYLSEDSSYHPHREIFKHVSSYIQSFNKFFIEYFTKNLIFEDMSRLQQWNQKIIELTLSMVLFEPEIIYQGTLDQILICNMFGAARLLKIQSIKFQEIISIYRIYCNNDQLIYEPIIYNNRSILNREARYKDIIQFYNNEFIKYLNDTRQNLKIKQIQNIISYFYYFNEGIDEINIEFKQLCVSPTTYQNLNISKRVSGHNYSNKYSKQKQNSPYLSNNLLNINLTKNNQGIVTVQANLCHPGTNVQFSQSKSLQQSNKMTFDVNINGNRDPTRIKERKNMDLKQSELCVTKKTKHPIFSEFQKDQ